MIQHFYIKDGCFTKDPFKNGCLGFQVYIITHIMTVNAYQASLVQAPSRGLYRETYLHNSDQGHCRHFGLEDFNRETHIFANPFGLFLCFNGCHGHAAR